MNFAGAQRITIRRVTTADLGMGNTSETASTRTWRAMVEDNPQDESMDPRSPRVVLRKTLYGEPVALDFDDELVIGGETYRLSTLPQSWPWPGGGQAGIVVRVERAVVRA